MYDVNGAKRTIYALHHAAAFACTRWTNLYFPAWLGFFGDLVGGPLRDIFGPGVKDIAVTSAEWSGWLQHTPMIHTHYWNENSLPITPPVRQSTWSLKALREALDLESRTWLPKAAP